VRRLTHPTMFSAADVPAAVGAKIHTGALEQSVGAGKAHADCVRRTNAHQSEIVMMVFAMQLLSGKKGRAVPPDGRDGRGDGS
jgi:hypothetical protein